MQNFAAPYITKISPNIFKIDEIKNTTTLIDDPQDATNGAIIISLSIIDPIKYITKPKTKVKVDARNPGVLIPIYRKIIIGTMKVKFTNIPAPDINAKSSAV